MTDYIEVKFHFGGRLEFNPTPNYIGGETFVFPRVDCDKMAVDVFCNSAKMLGLKDVELCWYKFPSEDFEHGLKPLTNDYDVHDILNSIRTNHHSRLEVYVVHGNAENDLNEVQEVVQEGSALVDVQGPENSDDDIEFIPPDMEIQEISDDYENSDDSVKILSVDKKGLQGEDQDGEDVDGLNDQDSVEDKDDPSYSVEDKDDPSYDDNESEYGDSDELVDNCSDDENGKHPHCIEFHGDGEDPLMKDSVVELGMVYRDHLEFKRVLKNYAIQRCFDYVSVKSDRTRVTAVCKSLCGWRIHASLTRDKTSFQVKSFQPDHGECCFHNVNTKVTARWLAQRYLEKFKDDLHWDLTTLQGQVKRDYNVAVTSGKCYTAKRLAQKMITKVGGDSQPEVGEASTRSNPQTHSLRAMDKGKSASCNGRPKMQIRKRK